MHTKTQLSVPSIVMECKHISELISLSEGVKQELRRFFEQLKTVTVHIGIGFSSLDSSASCIVRVLGPDGVRPFRLERLTKEEHKAEDAKRLEDAQSALVGVQQFLNMAYIAQQNKGTSNGILQFSDGTTVEFIKQVLNLKLAKH
jgi:hypothetical protein